MTDFSDGVRRSSFPSSQDPSLLHLTAYILPCWDEMLFEGVM